MPRPYHTLQFILGWEWSLWTHNLEYGSIFLILIWSLNIRLTNSISFSKRWFYKKNIYDQSYKKEYKPSTQSNPKTPTFKHLQLIRRERPVENYAISFNYHGLLHPHIRTDIYIMLFTFITEWSVIYGQTGVVGANLKKDILLAWIYSALLLPLVMRKKGLGVEWTMPASIVIPA